MFHAGNRRSRIPVCGHPRNLKCAGRFRRRIRSDKGPRPPSASLVAASSSPRVSTPPRTSFLYRNKGCGASVNVVRRAMICGDYDMDVTELLARAWIECGPNRGGVDPDETIGQSCSGSSDGATICEDTPLTGKPKWHWFVPRAEALNSYLQERGFKIVPA